MVKLRVKLFAGARDAVGDRELLLDVPDGTTAAGLVHRLAETYPALGAMVPSLRVAVNREYVGEERRLRDGDEVALIPPVSGGSDMFEITEGTLSLDALTGAVCRTTSGAVATFLGVVREFSRGRRVTSLEYEAYPEMATASMRAIGEEIRHRWPVDHIAIVHRVGRLTIGDASVGIAVSAPHRREALEACAYAIERLKEVVPIWKKEIWADGTQWIGSTVEEYRDLHEEAQRRGGAEAPPRPPSHNP